MRGALNQRAIACLLAALGSACGDSPAGGHDTQDSADALQDAGDRDADAYGRDVASEIVDAPHDTRSTVPVAGPSALPAPGEVLPSIEPATQVPVDPASAAPRFEERWFDGLSDYFVPVDFASAYGPGVAAFDADLDGDLDLLIGATQASRACVLENRLEEAGGDFEAPLSWCIGDPDAHRGGIAAELDGTPGWELVLAGRGAIVVVHTGPGPWERNRVPLDDWPCHEAQPYPFDVDHDGDLDLWLTCGFRRFGETENIPDSGTLWLLNDGAGAFARAEDVAPPFARTENTVAIATLDVNEDGLLDLITAVDTFSTMGFFNVGLLPGGIAQACPPDAGCAYEHRDFVEGVQTWGSYMGVGNVLLDDGTEALFLADWGPNRLFDLATGMDRLEGHPTAFDLVGSEPSFSWGVVVDDFDRDGLDDIFVSQGVVGNMRFRYEQQHDSGVLWQQPGGTFVSLLGAAGVRPEGIAAAAPDTRMPAYRAALKLDLDADGRLDVLLGPWSGRPRVLSERPPAGAPPRCTLAPVPTVVPSAGYGFAVREAGGPWRRRDVQGQLYSGNPPLVLTETPEGELRFPSGVAVPYRCDGVGPTVVEEPAWIDARVVDGVWTLSIDARWWVPGEVDGATPGQHVDADGGDGEWRFHDAPIDAPLMVRVDGRWVGRWWSP